MNGFAVTKKQAALLREAKRRWELHGVGQHTGGQTLTTAWTGFGSASIYEPVVAAGLMEHCHPPNPGHTCWWRLTEKGVLAMIILGWLEGD